MKVKIIDIYPVDAWHDHLEVLKGVVGKATKIDHTSSKSGTRPKGYAYMHFKANKRVETVEGMKKKFIFWACMYEVIADESKKI